MSSNRYGLQSDASQSGRRPGSFENYDSSFMGSPRRSEDLRQEDYADAPGWWRPTNIPQPRRTRVVHAPINRHPSQSQFDPRRTYINAATPRRLPFPNASEALSQQLGNTTNDLLAEDPATHRIRERTACSSSAFFCLHKVRPKVSDRAGALRWPRWLRMLT